MKHWFKRNLRPLVVTPCKATALICLMLGALPSGPSAQRASSGQHGKPSRTSKTLPMSDLRAAGRVLEQISAKSDNGIPDGVLNRTKCLVVIPSMKENISASGGGVSTCREAAAEWSNPALVQFNGHGIRGRRADLLVFVLSENGTQALRAGELQIGRERRRVAPLIKTSPVPTEAELNAEMLTYQYSSGVLSGSEVSGVIRVEGAASNPIPGRAPTALSGHYRSSVISFFNTIIATGIVLHHSALIPGEKKVPRKESDIDEYHQERGFEILCSGRVYHVAYHYLIMPNGAVKAGRPERCEGAHAAGYNSYLGISVVGDFSSEDNPTGKKGPTRPNARQIASLVRLCRGLRRRYKIPVQHIVRHSDVANTQCPGDRFPFRLILDQLRRTSASRSR
jgi:N-acetylmuramoyl-L-alanine amidase